MPDVTQTVQSLMIRVKVTFFLVKLRVVLVLGPASRLVVLESARDRKKMLKHQGCRTQKRIKIKVKQMTYLRSQISVKIKQFHQV